MRLALSQQFDEEGKSMSFVTTLSSDFSVSRSSEKTKIVLGSSHDSRAHISFDDEELSRLLEALRELSPALPSATNT